MQFRAVLAIPDVGSEDPRDPAGSITIPGVEGGKGGDIATPHGGADPSCCCIICEGPLTQYGALAAWQERRAWAEMAVWQSGRVCHHKGLSQGCFVACCRTTGRHFWRLGGVWRPWAGIAPCRSLGPPAACCSHAGSACLPRRPGSPGPAVRLGARRNREINGGRGQEAKFEGARHARGLQPNGRLTRAPG